ncbi:hypothetical protein ACRTEB_23330 [Vibrio alginolyticus]|uniref:hypothetical protein n=1 Tax=Vibrio alginolyticus TaxID=663 RepID=UPI003D7C7473
MASQSFENNVSNLEKFIQSSNRVAALDWDYIEPPTTPEGKLPDPCSELLTELLDAHLWLTPITQWAAKIDKNASSYFDKVQSNIQLCIWQRKSKSFYMQNVHALIDEMHSMLERTEEIRKANSNHGGKREGSGRKKATPTKQIRIDADLAEPFKELSELYRGQTDTDKAYLLENVTAVGVSFCQEKAAKHALDD